MTAKAENKKRAPSTASPFAGCSIVIAAMVSMLFLVGFVIWNLNRLDSEISKFTQDDPQPLPVPEVTENTRSLNDLKARLNKFATAAGTEEPAEITFSTTDLNLGIAAFDAFEELRGKFSVMGIENERLLVNIAFPLNGRPLSGELRYLNGTMVASPRLTEGEIVLDIEEVRVPEGTVPDGFLGQLSPHRITERYKEDPLLGPWLASLTSVQVSEHGLVLTAAKLGAPPAEVDPGAVKSGAKRALLLFGVLVLLLLLTLALVFFFTKKRRAAAAAITDAATGKTDGE